MYPSNSVAPIHPYAVETRSRTPSQASSGVDPDNRVLQESRDIANDSHIVDIELLEVYSAHLQSGNRQAHPLIVGVEEEVEEKKDDPASSSGASRGSPSPQQSPVSTHVPAAQNTTEQNLLRALAEHLPPPGIAELVVALAVEDPPPPPPPPGPSKIRAAADILVALTHVALLSVAPLPGGDRFSTATMGTVMGLLGFGTGVAVVEVAREPGLASFHILSAVQLTGLALEHLADPLTRTVEALASETLLLTVALGVLAYRRW
jgi:hypothetical protein